MVVVVMDARRHAMMLAVVGVSGGGSTDTQLTVGTDSENVQEGRKEGRERTVSYTHLTLPTSVAV